MKPFLTAFVWLLVIVAALIVLGRDMAKHLHTDEDVPPPWAHVDLRPETQP